MTKTYLSHADITEVLPTLSAETAGREDCGTTQVYSMVIPLTLSPVTNMTYRIVEC